MTQSEIILYDLKSEKDVCFSPVVWRIRLILNYKQISYETIFLEFPDIEPTLSNLGIPPPDNGAKYTVPAIKHVPSGRYLMDSTPIAKFLETTYPSPPLPLTSTLGDDIAKHARTVIGPIWAGSIVPREVSILSPRSQEYFRKTREASMGKLEDLLVGEEDRWKGIEAQIRASGGMMRTNRDKGPFVLGQSPSYTDFFICGSLQSARVVDEGVFDRMMGYEGYKDIYEACGEWLKRKD